MYAMYAKPPHNGIILSAWTTFYFTDTAMTKIVTDLLVNVDSSSPSLLLTWNISAAFDTPFDTLNHERLLQRAKDSFHFTGHTNLWLSSYLADRHSFVSMGTCASNMVSHTTSVNQGSVLGSLLFSIFTSSVVSRFSRFQHHAPPIYQWHPVVYVSLNTSTGNRLVLIMSQNGTSKMPFCWIHQRLKPWLLVVGIKLIQSTALLV